MGKSLIFKIFDLERREIVTARHPLVKTFDTGRMLAGEGPHWETQRLVAHTTLLQRLVHCEPEEGRKGMMFFDYSFDFVWFKKYKKQPQ